jgi:hypothetical protein
MTGIPEERVRAGLRRIRRYRISFLAVVGAYIPVVAVLYLLSFPPPVILAAGATLMTVGIVIEVVIGFSRCPACRAHFHVRGMAGSLLTRRCMNCGIPLKGGASPT